ncbi:MAG: molybdenum ABC transporter ATP-binding protein [Desulfuromonadales bacterium GWD2_61_12]|nr:MAG: molybdenum ABC transporter ATP-binding protein [Desulfuromonadales bacterium GWC2_61_20]OGR34491.1 MAG: molybdenum ABC transporter ATP-binding protein [Desulfuromonadales bacterium GWD2_61_12]HAD04248.1 molybdenum ABC transporter ATP-binding protein [Desulfuromonas sp.]HBT82018.1 molybdenum ABC transporter ATP-binding protein [Desulfuromonas sp.]
MELTIQANKSFGSFTLNADCSLSGERIGVFGPSGGGKSTLVRLIAGLETPESGEISLDGEILFSRRRKINLPPQQRRIAIVFQDARLFPHLSVRDNLLYGFKRCVKKGETGIDFTRLVATLQLDGLLERGVETLSGGQKQRVALGRAILANPRLLLMDEPLSALDDTLRFQIIPYLRSVSEEFGIPYLFISHSLNEMRLMTDAVLECAEGMVSGPGTLEELARRRMGSSQSGYINLLELREPRLHDGLYVYRWGTQEIFTSAGGEEAVGMFELSSKEITLFKRHPEATSARNMLSCRVTAIFSVGSRVGVELDCGGQKLVSQVVGEAVRDLELTTGSEIIAVIKASAFRRLY